MSNYTPTPCRGRNCKSDGSGVSPDGDHSKECLNDAELMICGIDAIIAERDEARAALSADGGEAAKRIAFLTSETDRLREALAHWQNRASELADGGEDKRDVHDDVISMHRDFAEWAETKDFKESEGPYATPEANAAWAAWRECMDMRGAPDAQVIEVRIPQGGGAITETRTQVQMLRPLVAGTKLYAAVTRENEEISK